MMVHIIVDFQHLYYKYKFSLEKRRLPRVINSERDYSIIYYVIDELERIRQDNAGALMSVCFESNSNYDKPSEYKKGRVNKLGEEDRADIELIQRVLRDAGYNIYVKDGYEADDLIGNLVRMYGERFDETLIYTPDADMLAYVNEKVRLMRHKIGLGYAAIGMHNFERYVSKEFKSCVPYNAVMLYKATVGDKSDNIKGIPMFGPKAFDKLVEYLNGVGVDWAAAASYCYTHTLLEVAREYLGDKGLAQAKKSLELVRLREFEIEEPKIESSAEARINANRLHNMKIFKEQ